MTNSKQFYTTFVLFKTQTNFACFRICFVTPTLLYCPRAAVYKRNTWPTLLSVSRLKAKTFRKMLTKCTFRNYADVTRISQQQFAKYRTYIQFQK